MLSSADSINFRGLQGKLENIRDAKKGAHWIDSSLNTHTFNLWTRIVWAVSRIFPCLRKRMGAASARSLSTSLKRIKAKVLASPDASLARLFNAAAGNYNSLVKKEKHHVELIEKVQPRETKPPTPLERIKEKVGKDYFAQIEPRLKQIGDLIDRAYDPSGENKKLFYTKLEAALYFTGKNLKYVKTADPDLSMPIKKFLEKAYKNLLLPGSMIKCDFINIFLSTLVAREENDGSAIVSDWAFRLEGNKPSVLPGFHMSAPEGKKVKRILIPVNINNMHWVLYSCSMKVNGTPRLERYDSLPEFSKTSEGALEKLEQQMARKVGKAFGVKVQSYSVAKPQVEQQPFGSNDCGLHVCKNAEWLALNDGKVNPEQLSGEAISKLRLEILHNIL